MDGGASSNFLEHGIRFNGTLPWLMSAVEYVGRCRFTAERMIHLHHLMFTITDHSFERRYYNKHANDGTNKYQGFNSRNRTGFFPVS